MKRTDKSPYEHSAPHGLAILPRRMRLAALSVLVCISSLLGGCGNMLGKLDHIGKPPPMAEIVDPQVKPEYQPMTWPMPEDPPPSKQYANSLWQPGARAFFRDGRAARVGDILRVKVRINDKLQFNNQTEGKRTYVDEAAVPDVLGFGNKIAKLTPIGKPNPASLLDISGNYNTKGTGTISRQDVVTTEVAAMVTQMLPNGNLVIEGKQEVTMNYDVREVSVRGVVRPQDIDSDNTIDSSQIAEARIAYTGRGQLNNMQQPRWGGQIVDAVSPF